MSLTIVGIIDIWLRAGLDLAEILLLQGIFGVFVMILEFPSGLLADLTDRSTLLGYSYIAMMLGVLCYLLGSTYLWFILAEFMFAVGMAGKSGADTAQIYDTFLEREQESDAMDILASGKSIVYAGMMIQVALGGVLAAVNWRIPLIIAVLGFIGIAGMYFTSYEPERLRHDNSGTAMRDAVSYLKLNSVAKLALMLLIVQVGLRIAFWDYIPKMKSLSVNAFWFGFVLAGANGIAFLTSVLVRRNKDWINLELIFVSSGIIGLFLFINQVSLIIILVAIAGHQIARGGSSVIFDIKLNQLLDSEVRASLASLISTIIQGSYFMVILLFNIFMLEGQQIHWINAIIALVMGVIIVVLNHSTKVSSPSINLQKQELSEIELIEST